jgi:hypothetical protein
MQFLIATERESGTVARKERGAEGGVGGSHTELRLPDRESIEAGFEADLRGRRVYHGTKVHATSPDAGKFDASAHVSCQNANVMCLIAGRWFRYLP